MSAHNLQIEQERYTSKNRVPPELRLCKACNSNESEDEFHFVMKCPKYKLFHHNLMENIKGILMFPFFTDLNDKLKFIWLMANVDKRDIDVFTAFIYRCFNERSSKCSKD